MASQQPPSDLLNHDDRALYRYLQLARGDGARLALKITVQKGLPAPPGAQSKAIKARVIRSLAQFIGSVEEGIFSSESKVAPWPAFCSFYKLNGDQKFRGAELELKNYRYFSRDVLLLALANDQDQVAPALIETYRIPARRFVEYRYPALANNSTSSFEDVFQEACANLFAKPPVPDRKHSAQLFTIFRTILQRRCADIFRGKSTDEEISTDEEDQNGNNFADFTDHIIETYGLADKFGSDDAFTIIKTGMERLEDKCRNLLRLRFYRNKKSREISELTGYSTDSVGTRVKRCLQKLRRLLFGDK